MLLFGLQNLKYFWDFDLSYFNEVKVGRGRNMFFTEAANTGKAVVIATTTIFSHANDQRPSRV